MPTAAPSATRSPARADEPDGVDPVTSWGWEELAGRALARQLPVGAGAGGAGAIEAGADAAGEPGVEQVAAWLEAVGPIQSQTARSPFIGLAARFPALTHGALRTAYAAHAVVRGSVVRGTVHTTTPAVHAVHDAVTRIGQRTLWTRTLRPERVALEEVWSDLEAFAADEWRTSGELLDHLRGWLTTHESPGSAARLDDQSGRYFAFGHGGLVRRPLRGGWDGQGLAGYRTAATLLGPARPLLPAPADAVDAAVRMHVRAHGPSSRNDIAWWSGLGLTVVDAAVARVGEELVSGTGPDGRTYLDLATGVPDPVDPASVGIRLLPEFDALLCGYDPRGRERFVSAERHQDLWSQGNGFMVAPMLRAGRLAGHWRVEGGATRALTVTPFRGTGRLGRRALDEAVLALERGLGIRIGTVEVAAAR